MIYIYIYIYIYVCIDLKIHISIIDQLRKNYKFHLFVISSVALHLNNNEMFKEKETDRIMRGKGQIIS